MKIIEIYERYKIMPQLQLHMLRVAGVASIIVDNFKEPLDKASITSACLLHDMGNIIKFDLTKFPDTVHPEGLDYWERIKNEYIKKYGSEEHTATDRICKELNISKKIMEMIEGFGFSKGKITSEINVIEIKISAYSDHRVSPYGIWQLDKKLNNMYERYKSHGSKSHIVKDFKNLLEIWKRIEIQIFENCKITPDFITDEKVNPLLETLKNFEIETKND